MIRPPRFRGTAFSEASDGDLRHGDRHQISVALHIPSEWATVEQVHEAKIMSVRAPGGAGQADGLMTGARRVPVAVFTADCLGVVLEADAGVGVAHAGWRGLAAGVVGKLLASMEAAGWRTARAAIGPSIGPCCFEVGPEVVAAFPDFVSQTSWGTPSIDLWGAARAELASVGEVWSADRCTRCDEAFFSHRRDGTPRRLAAIGWIP